MQLAVPARNPHEENGGSNEEQTRRGAVSAVIEAVRKRKYCTPMEFNGRKGRNDSLKLKYEKHLKKEKRWKHKKTKNQLPLAPHQHAPEAHTLQMDKAFSEDSIHPPEQQNDTTASPKQA